MTKYHCFQYKIFYKNIATATKWYIWSIFLRSQLYAGHNIKVSEHLSTESDKNIVLAQIRLQCCQAQNLTEIQSIDDWVNVIILSAWYWLLWDVHAIDTRDRLYVAPPPEAQDRRWCDIKLIDTVICNENYMYINFQIQQCQEGSDLCPASLANFFVMKEPIQCVQRDRINL